MTQTPTKHLKHLPPENVYSAAQKDGPQHYLQVDHARLSWFMNGEAPQTSLAKKGEKQGPKVKY
jgi:hypothetical protein